ncbi:hypothetical protein LTR10_003425 [Elasticomyces elasticus]|nr:hypothetical protein LTR10_003425 [Elasticomyces elasticus]KAK4969693.1 hypothetical protein LTR42_008965 [Elasticomyces elasticus]
MSNTTTYAVLGSTGNCGSALVEILLKRPNARINAYCRNRSKLLARLPSVQKNERVRIFEGSITDTELLASCIQGCRAVFLCVSTNDNIPGCRLAQDTAIATVKALRSLKYGIASPPGAASPPRLVLLSSGTIDEQFSRHVPLLLQPILLRSASYVYQDLVATEEILRAEEDWLTSIYMKPGALSVDMQRGYALSFTDQDGPTSYFDLAAGMIEVADDTEGRYNQRNVSMVCTNGAASFPAGTPLCILTGLLRHYMPWLHPYLPLNTGPK